MAIKGGSTGSGPDPDENNEPEIVRGATPGQRDTGYQSIGDDAEKGVRSLGRLTSAVSKFTSTIGGDKRKLTEFTTALSTINTELEEMIRLLDEAGEKSGGIGGGKPGGGLWTPPSTSAGGVSYTKGQLPTPPGVDETVTRTKDLDDLQARRPGTGDGGPQGPRIPSGVKIAGGAAATGAYLLAGWFANQTEQAAMVDMQERRFGLTGTDPQVARAGFDDQFARRNFRDGAELFTTQESLEQRGMRLGSDTFTSATESAGVMRQFMPHMSTEAIAGAGAELAHGQAGRELRMRGVTQWGDSTDESFRKILMRVSNTGQMPTREVLQVAQPGTAFYESLMVLLNGDTEMVRMVLDWGVAEAHSVAETGQRIQLTEEHAGKLGLGGESVFGADLSKDAAQSGRRLEHQNQLSASLRRGAERAESVADWFDSIIPHGMQDIGIMLGSAFSQIMSSAGDLLRGIGVIGAAMAATSGGRAVLGRVGSAAASAGSRAWSATGGRITSSRVATAGRGTGGGGIFAKITAPVALWATSRELVQQGRADWRAGQDVGEEHGGRARWVPWGEERELFEERSRQHLEEIQGGEPAGGPPIGYVEGADHDGPGYSARGFGGVKSHVAQAGHYIDQKFGPFPGGVGGVGKRSGKSDHPRGLALDFMTMKNTKLGDRVAAFLQKNAKHFGVKYIIWKQRINSGDGRGWRKMEDRGSITANHFDHPHVSFEDAPGSGTGGFDGELSDFDDYGEEDREAVTNTGFSSSALPSSASATRFSSEEADILSGIFGGGSSSSSTGGVGGSSTSPGYSDDGGARPSVSGTGTLSDAEIAKLARYGGWSGDELVTATAIALAESRGNPGGIGDTHINPGTGEQSTGLWQIHYRPDRDRNNPTRDPSANLDPHKNAKNAYRIYQDQGWGAWSVHPAGASYTPNNSYTNYLDRARQAVGGVEPAGGLDMSSAISEGSPSGGTASMSVGGVPPTMSSSQTRQVNVKMDISIERASRQEAERLADMVMNIVKQEEGIQMVGMR